MSTDMQAALKHRSQASRAQSRLAWLLIAPTILILGVVIVIPVIQSLYQSFFAPPELNKSTGFFD